MQAEQTFKPNIILRALAQLVSYVFHPLFIPLYVTAFIVYQYPYFFAGFDNRGHIKVLMSVFINLCFFPALVVFLLWRLKFASSIMLRTQKERIIPFAASLVFYFWAWYVFREQPQMPRMFVQFLFGAFLGVSGAWMANIFIKISMHTTAMGGMAAYMLLLAFNGDIAMGGYLSIALLLSGLVGTARMLVSDHTNIEVYTGFAVGALAQLIAAWLA
ncbi:MAG: hypothetical protein ACO1NW_02360 [Chitinophagaceae bacterium]